MIWAPIGGVDKERELLVKTLEYGDCKKAVQQLFSKIAEDTGFAASHTDALDLFDAMRSQTGGGGILVDLTFSQLNDHLPEAGRINQQPSGVEDYRRFSTLQATENVGAPFGFKAPIANDIAVNGDPLRKLRLNS